MDEQTEWVVLVDGAIVHGPTDEIAAHNRKRLLRAKDVPNVKVKQWNTTSSQ